MAPRDSGIGNDLDLELDEDYEEENMDEERWIGHFRPPQFTQLYQYLHLFCGSNFTYCVV